MVFPRRKWREKVERMVGFVKVAEIPIKEARVKIETKKKMYVSMGKVIIMQTIVVATPSYTPLEWREGGSGERDGAHQKIAQPGGMRMCLPFA